MNAEGENFECAATQCDSTAVIRQARLVDLGDIKSETSQQPPFATQENPGVFGRDYC